MAQSQQPSTIAAHRPARVCMRSGCENPVNKATAKYCSVTCCNNDPIRRAQIRERSRVASRQVLPMSRQLSIRFASQDATELMLERLCEGREDTPLGMARLVV